MEIIYCKKCHQCKRGKNINEVNKDLFQIFGVEVKNKCSSYCGPGRKEYFVEVNEEIITASSMEELLENLKENYDN